MVHKKQLTRIVVASAPVSMLIVAAAVATDNQPNTADSSHSQQITIRAKTEPPAAPTAQTAPAENQQFESSPQPTNSSSTSMHVQASTGSGGNGSVTINNKTLPLPESGSIHQTFSDASGTTNVDVTVDGNSTVNLDSNGSVNIQVESNHVSDGVP